MARVLHLPHSVQVTVELRVIVYYRTSILFLLTIWGICASEFASAEVRFSPGRGRQFFNRNPFNLFQFGGLRFNANGTLDLTNFFPQKEAGFSRISQLKNQNGDNLRRFLVNDPKNGFVTHECRLDDFGGTACRLTDAFGNPVQRFFSFATLPDNEALRQGRKVLLERVALGDFNNLGKIISGNIDLRDIIAVNNLAAREVGPKLARGEADIQCDKDDPNGYPTDILAGKVNSSNENQQDPSYLALNWKERCAVLVANILNDQFADCKHQPVKVDASMVGDDGVLRLKGLQKNFSLRSLGIIFAKADNNNYCNSEAPPQNQMWSIRGLMRQAMNPDIVNLVRGYNQDNVNENLFLEGLVNLTLPTQLLGRVGARLTDHFFSHNKQSGVATSEQYRETLSFQAGGVTTQLTRDTNFSVNSGVRAGSQNVFQTGRNNLANEQSEGFQYFPNGCRKAFLAAAPDKDGNSKLAREAPASAANISRSGANDNAAAHAGVNSANCVMCHAPDAVSGFYSKKGGPYNVINVANTNNVANVSSAFNTIRSQFMNFISGVGGAVKDVKSPDKLKNVLGDAMRKINMPQSPEFVAAQLGYPVDVLKNLMASQSFRLSQLGVDQDGNIDPLSLESGGRCSIKAALGDPRRYQQVSPEALAARGTGNAAGGRAQADTAHGI